MIERDDTRPRSCETRISWIRRHGWRPAVLRRAIAALTPAGAEPRGAIADAPLAAELIRWLEVAANDADGFVFDPDCGYQHASLPPVAPELEPIAAILAAPATERLARLRAAYADPVGPLIAVLDDLEDDERLDDPDLPWPQFEALPLLAELSTRESLGYLLDWMNELDVAEPPVDPVQWMDHGRAVAALEHAAPEMLFNVAVERWASLRVPVRERVARSLGARGARDDRFFELLVAWLQETWLAKPHAAEMAVFALEAYRDPRAAAPLHRFLDACLERRLRGFAEIVADALADLGAPMTEDQRTRLESLPLRGGA
jgi:hypothetical protein